MRKIKASSEATAIDSVIPWRVRYWFFYAKHLGLSNLKPLLELVKSLLPGKE
jgi:hypothetical protein